MDKKIETKEFERIKVEDTKVVNSSVIRNSLSTGIDEKSLSSLTLEELEYMLEYEDHDKQTIELIKRFIKQKK